MRLVTWIRWKRDLEGGIYKNDEEDENRKFERKGLDKLKRISPCRRALRDACLQESLYTAPTP